jgi:hypothetical protein
VAVYGSHTEIKWFDFRLSSNHLFGHLFNYRGAELKWRWRLFTGD